MKPIPTRMGCHAGSFERRNFENFLPRYQASTHLSTKYHPNQISDVQLGWMVTNNVSPHLTQNTNIPTCTAFWCLLFSFVSWTQPNCPVDTIYVGVWNGSALHHHAASLSTRWMGVNSVVAGGGVWRPCIWPRYWLAAPGVMCRPVKLKFSFFGVSDHR